MTEQVQQPTDGNEETTTLEEAHEVGYLGIKVDPEPNEVYTVAGVTAQAEADAKAAKEAKPAPTTDEAAKSKSATSTSSKG